MVNGDGLTGIGFDVDVVVVEVPTDNATVTSVNDAYESITKEHEERQYIQLKLEIHYLLLHRIMDLQCHSFLSLILILQRTV